MIFGLRPPRCLRSGFRPKPAGSGGGAWPFRREAGEAGGSYILILGRRLWDALSLINSYYETNDFGSLAVPGGFRSGLITYLLPIHFLFISYSITYFIFVTFSILPIYFVAF